MKPHGNALEAKLVFVFGTLKQGFPNFATNRGRRVGDPAQASRYRTQQRYPLYLVGPRHSPWLLDAPGQGAQVLGELYAVSAEVLADMDRLERVQAPDGYVRQRIMVEPVADDGSACGPAREAFVYLKRAEQLDPAEIRLGPLAEYQAAHAALYQPRV
ncbi:UNVERIFIED_ORG: gamma-glutamylcyclotransferase [Shinella sp. XGS7]|nr:gamma-glutamylcyclotransferase family protein [Shinella sp. XGS7]